MEPEPVRVTFRGRECHAQRTRDPNGGVAVALRDAEHGAFVAWATLNTPLADLKTGQVVVNDFDRTEGMLEALVTAGVVEPTGASVRILRLALPIVTLRVELPEFDRAGESNPLGSETQPRDGASRTPSGPAALAR